MLLELYNEHSRRACELVCAYEEAEITLSELEYTISSLLPEAVQTLGTAISGWVALSEPRPRLLAARTLCCRLASSSRARN